MIWTCTNGHTVTPEDTYIPKSGSKVCRICQREGWRKWYQRKKKKASQIGQSMAG